MARALVTAGLILGALAGPARAADDVLRFELSIESAASDGWRARALERALSESLAEHPRLEPAGDQAADLVVSARLGAERLEVAASIDGVPRGRGVIELRRDGAGVGLAEVRRQLNDQIAPLLRVDTAGRSRRRRSQRATHHY